mmetsp:Transcript_35065/g.68732  ORF Transcript_35065/g.68732 Transcript_35065/m.68732 type:complete len:523 (+) Transcript_35065:66-1634(+)
MAASLRSWTALSKLLSRRPKLPKSKSSWSKLLSSRPGGILKGPERPKSTSCSSKLLFLDLPDAVLDGGLDGPEPKSFSRNVLSGRPDDDDALNGVAQSSKSKSFWSKLLSGRPKLSTRLPSPPWWWYSERQPPALLGLLKPDAAMLPTELALASVGVGRRGVKVLCDDEYVGLVGHPGWHEYSSGLSLPPRALARPRRVEEMLGVMHPLRTLAVSPSDGDKLLQVLARLLELSSNDEWRAILLDAHDDAGELGPAATSADRGVSSPRLARRALALAPRSARDGQPAPSPLSKLAAARRCSSLVQSGAFCPRSCSSEDELQSRWGRPKASATLRASAALRDDGPCARSLRPPPTEQLTRVSPRSACDEPASLSAEGDPGDRKEPGEQAPLLLFREFGDEGIAMGIVFRGSRSSSLSAMPVSARASSMAARLRVEESLVFRRPPELVLASRACGTRTGEVLFSRSAPPMRYTICSLFSPMSRTVTLLGLSTSTTRPRKRMASSLLMLTWGRRCRRCLTSDILVS